MGGDFLKKDISKEKYRHMDKLLKRNGFTFDVDEKNTIEKILKHFETFSAEELDEIIKSGNEAYYKSILINPSVNNEIKNNILKNYTKLPDNLVILNDDIDISLINEIFSKISKDYFLLSLRKRIPDENHLDKNIKTYRAIRDMYSQKIINVFADDYIVSGHNFDEDLYPFIALSSSTVKLLDFAKFSPHMSSKMFSCIMSNENIPEALRNDMFDGTFNHASDCEYDIDYIINPTEHMLSEMYLSSVEALTNFSKISPSVSKQGDKFLCKLYDAGLLSDDMQYDIIKRFVNEGVRNYSNIITKIITNTIHEDVLKESLKLKSKQNTLAFFNFNLNTSDLEKALDKYLNKIKSGKMSDRAVGVFCNVIKKVRLSNTYYDKIISAINMSPDNFISSNIVRSMAFCNYLSADQYLKLSNISSTLFYRRDGSLTVECIKLSEEAFLFSEINEKANGLTDCERKSLLDVVDFYFSVGTHFDGVDFNNIEPPTQIMNFFEEINDVKRIKKINKSLNEIKLECIPMKKNTDVLCDIVKVFNSYSKIYRKNKSNNLKEHTDYNLDSMQLEKMTITLCKFIHDKVDFYTHVDEYIDDFNEIYDEIDRRNTILKNVER